MLRINVLGRDVLFTLARIVPPLEYKQVLNSGNEQSEEFKKVSGDYASALVSRDAHLLRMGVAIILNNYVFKDKDYYFGPMKEMYGLLPQYDNDAIVPFVSVKSLKGELK